jgi:hypothetical protein
MLGNLHIYNYYYSEFYNFTHIDRFETGLILVD